MPLDQIEAYLNFDMVGRMQDNKLTVQAHGHEPGRGASCSSRRTSPPASISPLQEDPYQPTDVASFNLASVPCLSFFTGTHADYHRPTDTADKIDYEDLDRVVDFAAAIARRRRGLDRRAGVHEGRAADADAAAAAPACASSPARFPTTRPRRRDCCSSGVIGGGPAEQAGLQKGDVIVEIAGQTITNIYDYTYALELLKIGQPVKVVYMRGGERKETMLTPAARK